jgi:hypothetical protein
MRARAAQPASLLGVGVQAQAEQDAAKKQEEAAQQHTAATQEQLNLFKKGFAACLEPKGYTVK